MKKNERAGFWAALEGKTQQDRPVTADRDRPMQPASVDAPAAPQAASAGPLDQRQEPSLDGPGVPLEPVFEPMPDLGNDLARPESVPAPAPAPAPARRRPSSVQPPSSDISIYLEFFHFWGGVGLGWVGFVCLFGIHLFLREVC